MPINLTALTSPGLGLINQNQNRIENNAQELITGKKINDASDNAAGLQVLVELQGQILGNSTAIRNTLDGTSALQIASGGLNQVTDALQQIREFGVQAGNGILNERDRASLQNQADQLLSGIRDTLGQSQFNGQSLLTSDDPLSLQVGDNSADTLDINRSNLEQSLTDLGLFSLDLSSGSALDSLNQAQELINQQAGQFGAAQNQLESTASRLFESNVNQTAAASRLGDTDFAQSLSERSALLIQQETAIALQAQANSNRGLVLTLLG